MANQVADNLSIANSIYYALVHPTQVHPFYNRFVFNAYGKNTLMGWVNMIAERVKVSGMTFLHAENDRLQLPIQSKSTVSAAGAGQAISITVGPDSSYLNAGAYDPVQPGYKLYDGVNYYTVTAVNTAVPYNHVLTAYPDNLSVTASFTAGQLLHVNKTVFVMEGSTATQSSLWGDGVVFTNYIQEMRRDETYTGQALNQFTDDVTFFDYTNPVTGEPERNWQKAEWERMMVEFSTNNDLYFITGQQVTNSAVSSAYGTGTIGVIPAIKAWGNVKNYSKVQSFQIADWEDMTLVMEKNNSVDEWAGWMGQELYNDMQNNIKDFFPNGAISYASFSGGQNQAIAWGFDSIACYGRTLHMHKLDVFNRPDFLGAAFSTAGDYPGCAIVLPMGKAQGVGGGGASHIQKATLGGNSYTYGFDSWIVDNMGYFSDSNFRPSGTRTVLFCMADAFGCQVNAAKQLFYIQRTN